MLKNCLLALFLMGMTSVVAAKDYREQDSVKAFIDEMEAKHGMDRDYLMATMGKARYQQSIIDAISRPAEKRLAWYEYRRIFMDSKRINNGKAFLQKYATTFDRAEREFGVSRYVVAAIIGVETRYGTYTGKYRVLDALATLGFDYEPRAKFFRGQLEELFLLAKEQNFAIDELLGSYAGAMGYGQFIPSSYRHYAIDFDGDHIVDILNNPIDAIGSVANYLARHNWQRGEEVVVPAVVSADLDESVLNDSLTPKRTVAELAAVGFGHESDAVTDDMKATAVRLRVKNGEEYWLGLQNFYAITRYNRSRLYAMAVYQLSLELGGK